MNNPPTNPEAPAIVISKGDAPVAVFSHPADCHDGGNGASDDPYYYATDGGCIRLWTKNGNVARHKLSVAESAGGGDWVKPDVPIPVEHLNPNPEGLITLYIEAVEGSWELGDVRIKAQLIPGPDAPEYESLTDTVRATVFHIETLRPQGDDFVQDHAGKIMISTKHCTTNTPLRVYTTGITTKANTPAQHHFTDGTHNRNVTITAYVVPIPPTNYPPVTVYFEVTDPDDRSPYDGKREPSDPTNHWPNDNRDQQKRMSWKQDGTHNLYVTYQGNALSTRTATAEHANINGVDRYAAETILQMTDRYAGDNYQVRATLRKPDLNNQGGRFDTHTGMNTNNDPYEFHASTIKQTIPLVAWKRVYIEQDNMYTMGATIVSNAPAGTTELYVDNATDFPSPYPRDVTVFWKHDGQLVSTNTVVLERSGNKLTVPETSQPILAYAGIKPQGHTATYDLTGDYLPQAFGACPEGTDGGAFIEFRPAPTGNDTNGVPKFRWMPTHGAVPYVWRDYCNMWFDNADQINTNVLYLLAGDRGYQGLDGDGYYDHVGGWFTPANGAAVVFTESGNKDYRLREKSVVHEIGHRFGPRARPAIATLVV